jgi:hypothetical protein
MQRKQVTAPVAKNFLRIGFRIMQTARPRLRHNTAKAAATDARKAKFVEAVQSDLPCLDPFAKIFLFSSDPNHLLIPCHPVPRENEHGAARFGFMNPNAPSALAATGPLLAR